MEREASAPLVGESPKRRRKRREAPYGFRATANLGVAFAGLVFLTPFAVNNFFQGRVLLGAGSLLIVLTLALNAWDIRRNRYRPWLVFFGLVPAIIFFLALAFQRQQVIGALWCFPAVVAFYFMLPEKKAWLANVALLAVAIPESFAVLDLSVALRVAVTLTTVSAFAAIFIRIILSQQRRLEGLAATDSLTGLGNRQLLEATLERAVGQSYRFGTPMALLALDLDHFKKINDTLGHDAGDRVLTGLGGLLKSRTRASDSAFRIGGEEFLILLHNAKRDAGRTVAENLRAAVEHLPLLEDRAVTVSVGVATLHPDETWSEWMSRADRNLYRAKAEGRNRVNCDDD